MATSSSGTVRIGALDVTRGPVLCSRSQLFIPFTIAGPGAGDWKPGEHVVILREGENQKLRHVDGTGGVEDDGAAFSVLRFGWSGGGGSIRIRYFDADKAFLVEQVVAVGPADANAGVKTLRGRTAFVGDDWLQPDEGATPPTEL